MTCYDCTTVVEMESEMMINLLRLYDGTMCMYAMVRVPVSLAY